MISRKYKVEIEFFAQKSLSEFQRRLILQSFEDVINNKFISKHLITYSKIGEIDYGNKETQS